MKLFPASRLGASARSATDGHRNADATRPLRIMLPPVALILVAALFAAGSVRGEVYNLRVVTDASPDYSDMHSMIHSIASRWETPQEKLWAMFYWNHIARRQTSPMNLHGMALTDPIRQFNDYGHTMCSTIAGINCSIWDAMGFPVKYWDISLHTVPEVYYDGRWHMYDNSMSAIYTLCDGETLAGVEDIGAEGACEASGGKVEPGHIARYHCLNATSPNGFLTGADTIRDLEQEYRCFKPSGLKYRYCFHDWDRGHRYILNLRRGESYTRHYRSLGEEPQFFVPNHGRDPEAANPRYRIRGNGVWTYQPDLSPAAAEADYQLQGIKPTAGGLQPAAAGEPGVAIFKIQSANVTTSQRIRAAIFRKHSSDRARISVSINNGLAWTEVWQADSTGELPVELELLNEVNGAYEVLVRVELWSDRAAEDCLLRSLEVQTTTMLNSKTQPKLNIGTNVVYVGAGDPSESIVFWPELQAGRYQEHVVEEANIASTPEHPGYQGTIHPRTAGEDAYLVYRLDAPRDLTRLVYGGRFYNRAPGSRCALLYSLDGKTWTESWSLTDIQAPWDVIHYETVQIPTGHRAVWVKYLMNTSQPSPSGCSIYAVRMEANHLPADDRLRPFDVTFNWSELKADGELVERSHTQRIEKLPTRYSIDVGGDDHPQMNWLRIGGMDATGETDYGYSDGRKDASGTAKHVGRWVTYGKNLAVGKSYTCSEPSKTNWDAGDPDGTRLTDGIAGPPCSGGTSYRSGALWMQGTDPVITLDLGAETACASFGMNFHGYPGWDALKGQIEDRVEVLTSLDGERYTSQGFLETRLRWKDLPANHMWPDDEQIQGHTFRQIPDQKVQARYVRFRVDNQRIFDCTELEVLDSIQFEPFDLRIALPDEQPAAGTGARTPPAAASGGKPDTSTAPAATSSAVSGKPSSTTAGDSPSKVSDRVADRARPLGQPVLEAPTLHSLGAYWIIGGDANGNARVDVAYRVAGETRWRAGMPLFRVERGAHVPEGGSGLDLPEGASLFAGSVVLLQPGTAYELKLQLVDPDGGESETTLTAHTIAEPLAPTPLRTLHVAPGDGGGRGTADDPYRGLAAAQSAARPGDLLLVRAGLYAGTFLVDKSSEPGRPIIWRGAGDDQTILDGQGDAADRPERVVSSNGVHDVWLEKLTLRNANYAIVCHRASRLVVRRCHMYGVNYGLTCTNNADGSVRGMFLADNLIEGPCSWPRSKGIEEQRGIQLTGFGHVVCYNRIRGFADAIDTFPSPRCEAIDFHNNDIDVMTDDGIEMDYSIRNTRCFLNRLTNVYQGISLQPVYGGPVYVFRNTMHNVLAAPFKLHNSPSGALLFHNTSVKAGMPLVVMTSAAVRKCVAQNNLFVGTSGSYAFESTAPMRDCEFDYCGFAGGPWAQFLKWNSVRYRTLEEVQQRAPVLTHAVQMKAQGLFASGLMPPQDPTRQAGTSDLSLAADAGAIDAGIPLAGVNDDFSGSAPDLGAHELGRPLHVYGPRPE